MPDSKEERNAKKKAYAQMYREKVKAKSDALKEELIAKEEKRKAYYKAYNQMYREKVIANQDKKAIQRAYEASNPILQEERNAYQESKKTAKNPNTGQHRSRSSILLTTISDSF